MAKNRASSSDKAVNLILIAVIAVVLVMGIAAVSKKLSNDAFERSIEDGTAPQTVATLARQEGLSVDEFLESYGMNDGTINGDSSQEDFYNHMSLEKYAAYQGSTYEELVSQLGLDGKVTETTTMEEAQKLIPLATYFGIDTTAEDGEAQFAQLKEYYGLGDDVTPETPYGDVEETIRAAEEAMINAMTESSDAEIPETAETSDAADAPAAE